LRQKEASCAVCISDKPLLHWHMADVILLYKIYLNE
jgi:hypothetical protein